MADPAGKTYASLPGAALQATADIIRERHKKKEEIKKDFIDQMSYDTTITGNNIINNRIAHEYGNLRNKHLKILEERKGWLTPEDTINLRSDMSALSSLANELKSAQSYYENARKAAQTRDGRTRFELDTDKWGDLMAVISGEEDVGNLVGYLNDLKISDTEFPFLQYRPFDLGAFSNLARKNYRNQFKGDIQEESHETEREGKRYISTKRTTSYGDDKQAREFYKNYFLGSPNSTNLSKGLQQELSESQKAEAMKLYGPESDTPSDTPFLDYYAYNIFEPTKFTQDIETTKRTVKPVRKGTGGLSLFFGGGNAGPGQYKPQADNVEGIDFAEYVEFAKAGRTPKTVKQVTVSGAEEISGGDISNPVDLTTPDDYTVAGYSLDKNRIILTKKDKSTGFEITESYMVPYRGNEHFLKDLFDEKTMQEIERRAGQERPPEQVQEGQFPPLFPQSAPGQFPGMEQQGAQGKWSKYKRQ